MSNIVGSNRKPRETYSPGTGCPNSEQKRIERQDREEQGSRPEGCELSYGTIPLNAELSDLKGTLSLDLILPGSWHFGNKQTNNIVSTTTTLKKPIQTAEKQMV